MVMFVIFYNNQNASLPSFGLLFPARRTRTSRCEQKLSEALTGVRKRLISEDSTWLLWWLRWFRGLLALGVPSRQVFGN